MAFKGSADEAAMELENALEHLEEALQCLRTCGLADDSRFRAYNLAQLEGHDSGWMGGPFLVDEVRKALEAVRELDGDEPADWA